jgi:hypothetical protein
MRTTLPSRVCVSEVGEKPIRFRFDQLFGENVNHTLNAKSVPLGRAALSEWKADMI